jgi:glycosyltransferase involved in cell wall biosynthesis
VLPAENEPWGLIVNEVMCAGVPVVVADEVGCVPDLVRDGQNGLLMQAGDVVSLTAALRRLLVGEAERSAMGRKCLEIIGGWSYERCRLGIVAATQSVHAAR